MDTLAWAASIPDLQVVRPVIGYRLVAESAKLGLTRFVMEDVMGLMGTLAKVAIGYAAARGVDRLSGGQGIGALLGKGPMRSADDPATAAQAKLASTPNPLQQLMSGLGGAAGAAASGNPLAALMGAGGAGIAGAAASLGGGGLGAMLDAFNKAAPDHSAESEAAAGLMLRAMIQAAKADGVIDEAEKARILEAVGDDASAEDMAFVQAQLAAPVDAKALAADTPEAQRLQVYSASLMTIRVDTEAEAAYLDTLARAMGLDQSTVNALHMQMGLQPLYG